MAILLEEPSVIEGIGPQRSRALADAGIETIAEMFAARAPRIGAILPSVAPAQIGGWFCSAVLLRVEDVTPDIAEALVDAGIRSVGQLADAGLRTLEDAVKAARDANRLREDVSLYKLSELQRNAWRARDTGMLAGRVLDKDGNALAGAVVDIGRQQMTVDAKGRYAFDRVPSGRIETTVQVPGRPRPLHGLLREIEATRLTGPIVHRIGAAPSQPLPVTVLDEMDGLLIVPTARYANREVTLPLSEFREGTHFLVREFMANDQVRLLSLFKKRRDDVTLIERARVASTDLPANAGVGDVLVLEAGKLAATTLTPAGVAALKWQKFLDTSPTRSRRVLRLNGSGG